MVCCAWTTLSRPRWPSPLRSWVWSSSTSGAGWTCPKKTFVPCAGELWGGFSMEQERVAGSRWLLPAVALVCSAVLGYLGTGLAPVAALTWLAPLPVLWLAPRVPVVTALGVAFGAFLLSTTNSWGFQLHSYDEPMVPVGLMINFGMSLTFVLTVWLFRTL